MTKLEELRERTRSANERAERAEKLKEIKRKKDADRAVERRKDRLNKCGVEGRTEAYECALQQLDKYANVGLTHCDVKWSSYSCTRYSEDSPAFINALKEALVERLKKDGLRIKSSEVYWGGLFNFNGDCPRGWKCSVEVSWE